jgi:ubiquitin carboxyl-terminal hydrolase 9/13
MCDDENVEPIADNDIYRYFGDYPSGAGYVLFYQAVDLDLASLGLKVPPTKPSSDLMDIDETQENEPVAESPKTPLRVTIPSPASPVTPIAPVIKPTPVDVPTLAPPIKPVVPAKTEFHNPFEDPEQHLGNGNGHAPANGTSPSALSSSVMSNDSSAASFSQETSSSRPKPPKHLSTSPLPNASAPVNISLGRNPSQSNKERVVSASSQSSTSGSTDKYAGGGGLSRRLSGISVSKLGRSGSMSFGKLGFGKKDKEKNGMGGVKE